MAGKDSCISWKIMAILLQKFFLIAFNLMKIVFQHNLKLKKARFIKLTVYGFMAMQKFQMIFCNDILKYQMEVFTTGKNCYGYQKR